MKVKEINKNSFNEKVYALLKKVPKGKVTTYKALAEKLNTRAYRAVGQAMKCNPCAPNVPCHRVVSSSGKIGGFMGKNNPESKEVRKKIKLLKREGVKIKSGRVVSFASTNYRFR